MKVKEFARIIDSSILYTVTINYEETPRGIFKKQDLYSLFGDYEVELADISLDGKSLNLNLTNGYPCPYYKTRVVRRQLTDYERGVYYGKYGEQRTYIEEREGYCTGTMEQDSCTCGGDKNKCNFTHKKSASAK